MRSVSGVGSYVKFQLLPAGKSLAAGLADDGEVYFDVFAVVVLLQTKGSLVVLVADGAVVFNDRPAVYDLVMDVVSVGRHLIRSGEVFPANFTLEGFLAGMEVLVFDSVCANGKSLPAYFALKFRGALVDSDVHFEVVLGGVAVFAQVAAEFPVVAMASRVKGEVHVVHVGDGTHFAFQRFVQLERRGVADDDSFGSVGLLGFFLRCSLHVLISSVIFCFGSWFSTSFTFFDSR